MIVFNIAWERRITLSRLCRIMSSLCRKALHIPAKMNLWFQRINQKHIFSNGSVAIRKSLRISSQTLISRDLYVYEFTKHSFLHGNSLQIISYFNSSSTKWPPFRRHFKVHFSWKFCNLQYDFTEIYSLGSNWQYANISWDNDLAPIQWRPSPRTHICVNRPQWVE